MDARGAGVIDRMEAVQGVCHEPAEGPRICLSKSLPDKRLQFGFGKWRRRQAGGLTDQATCNPGRAKRNFPRAFGPRS